MVLIDHVKEFGLYFKFNGKVVRAVSFRRLSPVGECIVGLFLHFFINGLRFLPPNKEEL